MKEQLDDLKAIREMMEKSSKFISLNGLAGILAGVIAIVGASFAYLFILRAPELTNLTYQQEVLVLVADALLVLVLAIGFAVHFSIKKAKKHRQKLLNKVTCRTLYNLFIPVVTGGIISLIMLYRGDLEWVAATMLIFYGLGLLNASKFTYGEIHYLGLTEIILGILAAVFIYNGLFFWTLGFGVCHILYGAFMYKKYEIRTEL